MSSQRVKCPKYSYLCHPSLAEPYALPTIVTQDMFDDAMSFQAASEDIFICAYPKCGTSWLQTALACMRREGMPLKEGEFVWDDIPFLEFVGNRGIQIIKQKPRIIKTHLYYEIAPWHDGAKYIFLARNPKDCFASFFHHTVGFDSFYEYKDGEFADYFELVIKGKVDSGDYFKHASEWWDASKKKPNILFVLYEDMKEDVQREFLKIVDFIGSGWSEKVRADGNELLKKMVEESSFDKMRYNENLFQSNEGVCQRPKSKPFIRRGIIGDWKNLFTEDQSRKVDERMKETGMKHPGFDHLWDKYPDQLLL